MKRLTLSLGILLAAAACGSAEENSTHFTFGAAPKDGAKAVQLDTIYTDQLGYGFDLNTAPAQIGAGAVSSDKPFYFSTKLPEGNYRVTLTLGDPLAESNVTIKAEARRLMIENLTIPSGKQEKKQIIVNIRQPEISTGGKVSLKPREKGALRWDNKLTLEFNGQHPAVAAIDIEPATDVKTVYLAGDSTVTDQSDEPWNSWGQMITRFFGPGVAVANHAESGESLKSSKGAHRLDKILSTIQPGDYLFIQFGHNDEKDKTEGAGPMTTFKDSLKQWTEAARAKQANVVLVTPVQRRRFDKAGKFVDTHGDYLKAVREAAKELNVPCIDLAEVSQKLYETFGPEKSVVLFQDGTHHNNFGSYEIARCITQGIRNKVPELAKLLNEDAKPFDPEHPDDPAKFAVPPNPNRSTDKPDGN